MKEDKPLSLVSLSARIDELAGKAEELAKAFEQLSSRIDTLEFVMPAELRTLSLDDIQLACKADPYSRFEVLVDWKLANTNLKAGQVLRQDQSPHLQDYVRHGLKLGVPRNHEEYVRKLRAETDARTKLATATAQQAQIAADSAAAVALAMQTQDTAEA